MAALWAVLALLVGAPAAARAGCGVAELACRGGGCVRLDAYCDGTPQCPDGSDEPPHCTVCNRTYYGRAGAAYSLQLREAPRVPFLCHLTFTAGGGAHGDLVQLAFEKFHVGRYEGGALDGCPDGYMQLAELGRPFTGGSWCGAAEGAALYYSETSTVTVSVKLFRARLGEPFEFHLRYKFLSQRDAVVRFGAAEAPLERGAVSPGTYCTRTYEECHRKRCRLQSPNYPGMYPRNVSCYWSLRQKDIPTCKHAMISVRQDYSHKMQIKRSISVASMNKTGRVLRAWRECTGERDRLIVYDGGSTDDPVLVEYCGGDWLPRVTARGPEMLVAFHSSPFSAPPRPAAPAAPLRGFEIDVDVIFADSDSLDYAREARRCEFHVKASSSEEETNVTAAGGAPRGRRGLLRAPQHTLPPNTTCTWTFHGRPGDLVWVYFSSYTHYSLADSRRSESGEREEETIGLSRVVGVGRGGAAGAERGAGRRYGGDPSTTPQLRGPTTALGPRGPCAVELRIWDGGGPGAPLVGQYCDTAPALCARAALANATRVPRPCSPPDGYVSSSGLLSMAATSLPGTATHPMSFALHYEFVDARLEGTPLAGGGHSVTSRRVWPPECARLLTSPGQFASPRNALWFGRGGARRLRCVYRLRTDGAVSLQLAAAAMGREPRCESRVDPRSGRTVCRVLPAPDSPDAVVELEPDLDLLEDDSLVKIPHLWIYDSPWPGYRVPLACICDNASAPLSLTTLGGALELELVAGALSPLEDQRHLHFHGSWSRDPAPSSCDTRRRLVPPGEHLHLSYPYENDYSSECGETPFLLSARGNRSVFVRVWGDEIPATSAAALTAAAPPGPEPPLCHTANRLLIYDAHTARLVKAICPGPSHEGARTVHVYSGEWSGGGAGEGAALLVVWAAREAGAARLHWMELWRASAAGASGPANATALCRHACAALGACMAGGLWCDGAEDCPGGADEAAGCGAGARLLRLLGGGARAAGAGGAAAAAAGAALLLLLACWRRRAASKRGLALGAARLTLTEELLFDSRASTAS